MKATFTTIWAVLLLVSCTPSKEIITPPVPQNYTLTIEAPGFADSTLFYLYSSDLQENLDSGYMVAGKLVMQGKVAFPQYAKVHTKFIPTQRNTYKKCRFWIENKEINVTGTFDDFKNSTVQGSPLNDMHNAISAQLENLDDTRDSLLRVYRDQPDPTSYVVHEIENYDSLRLNIIFDFIKENPNNEVCIRKLALYKSDVPLSELIDIFQVVDTSYYDYLHAQEIIKYIEESLKAEGVTAEDAILDFSGKPDFTTL